MDVIREGDAVPSLPNGSVVAVGAFDGVHLGHQRVIATVCRLARDLDCPAVTVVLDRVPDQSEGAAGAPSLLTGLAHRLELLDEAGIDVVLVHSVNGEPTAGSLVVLLGEILPRWGARAVVEGEDAHIAERVVAEGLGVEVESVPMLRDGATGDTVSSGAVRDALSKGDVRLAAGLVGRPHEIRGVVEHGDQRGRSIGFPTANLAVPSDIHLPVDGVYSGWYERAGGDTHVAAISIGRRPTFYEEAGLLLVEAYLLDFDGDLYGERAKVRLDDWIRGQERFGSVDELAAQLAGDVVATRRLVGGRLG